MKTVYISEIVERDSVNSVFLVRQKLTAMAKNGKPYMSLKLMDRTGEIEGRVWDRVEELGALFEKDDFVRVRGKANVYMAKMQLVIQDLAPVDEADVELANFLPAAPRPVDDMVDELHQQVALIEDPHLQALMQAFMADEAFMRGYRQAPAAKTMHHVYLGGLLDHSLSVARMARDVAANYPDIQTDLLVVGALLHDIGKVRELDYARSFDYTDEGRLLGHVVMGAQMVEQKIATIEGFPKRLATLLVHQMLSHHGQYDYGSPKRPKTLEAIVLSYLDDLDSKINGVQTHIAREPEVTGDWSSYNRYYDRYFFKGSPATPEAAKAPPKKASRPAAPKTADKPKKVDLNKPLGYSLADQLKQKTATLFKEGDEE